MTCFIILILVYVKTTANFLNKNKKNILSYSENMILKEKETKFSDDILKRVGINPDYSFQTLHSLKRIFKKAKKYVLESQASIFFNQSIIFQDVM